MQEPGIGQSQQPRESPMQTPQSSISGSATPGGSPIPSPTDYTPGSMTSASTMGANNSGLGAQSILPEELKGFNWGAFLMNWIWAIVHNTWIGLLALVPYVGFVMAFVLGFKGNEWAWQNRKWDSIEQFRTVQRIWTMWGIGIFVVGIVLSVLLMIVVAMFSASAPRTTAG